MKVKTKQKGPLQDKRLYFQLRAGGAALERESPQRSQLL